MTNDVYDHYSEVHFDVGRGRTEPRRRCDHCSQRYSISTSTTVLRQHLDQRHPNAPPPRASSCPPLKKQRTTQSTLHSAHFLDNAAFLPAISALFARCSLAHHVVDLPEFKNLIIAARSSNCHPPDRRQLRLGQAELAQILRARVVGQLKCYCRTSPLTVAIDGWTDVNASKVTNVVILCGGSAYYWCSIVNSHCHNTAVWLQTALVDVLNRIKKEGLNFAALVADNERVNVTLWELLLVPFPFLIRSPCAAHLIQLCVNKALDLPLIEPLFTAIETLVRHFRLKEPRLKLKNLQLANPLKSTAGGTPVVYTLLRPQDTRWSSWLYAAQRLLLVRAYVDMVIAQEPSFWANLDELVAFLKPFQVATDTMQEDGSTLFDVWRLFRRLLTHVRGTPPHSPVHASKDAIITIIIDLWDKHVDIDAVVACAQLSFDTSVDDIFPDKLQGSRRWFVDFAAKYALYWHIADSSDVDLAAVKRTALREWAAFLGRSPGTCFDHIDTDIDDLRRVHTDDKSAFPRAVWNLYLVNTIISHAAVALLSVCASEAAVERTFSAQGILHSRLRNRLADGTVENEMFIKFNQRTLAEVEGQQKRRGKAVSAEEQALGYCAEMGENYEEEEGLPSVVGLFSRPVAEVDSEESAAEAMEEKAEAAEPVATVISHVPRPPPTDHVQAFIDHIIGEMGVTPVYRWTESRQSKLWAEGQQWRPPMLDSDVVLQKKIMACVRAREAQDVLSIPFLPGSPVRVYHCLMTSHTTSVRNQHASFTQ